jgi:hypothetical protein
VTNDLRQLMYDATALAERLRCARLACNAASQPDGNLKRLEQELAQTWSAIRLARLPAAPAGLNERHHSKWE